MTKPESTGVARRSRAGVRKRPIHQMLVPFPVAYFAAAFATDLAYSRTAEVMWYRFSAWLIVGGLVMALLVALAAVIDLFRDQRPAWTRAFAYAAACVLSIFNVLVHSRDGYTAIVPTGLALSGVVLVLLIFAMSPSWTLTNRHRIGAKA